MQTSKDQSKSKRNIKRKNSRKKSLSPSDINIDRGDKVQCKRSLSEGSLRRHKRSNIRRTLTHPFTRAEEEIHVNISEVEKKEPVVRVQPESDESNLPPTSSDRDTEDERRPLVQPVVYRPTWDSGGELDSLTFNSTRRVPTRRRRLPHAECRGGRGDSADWCEASEPEAGRMRPEDYRLVFLSSDSSYREDTEDSSSTASSAAPPAAEDCDWDYFEPGAAATQAGVPLAPPPSTRTCSCGAEPRIVAVPVPVPVPVPAALWPALLAFPTLPPPTPHWHTYPAFLALDASIIARLTTAAAAAASALPLSSPIEMNAIDKTDKAIQSESINDVIENNQKQIIDKHENRNGEIEKHNSPSTSSDEIKNATEENTSVASSSTDSTPSHLKAEKAFTSSSDSGESTECEENGTHRSYDLTSGAPDEPATSDEDSDDSGGGVGRFSRVFVVNPTDSSSDVEDNADSSGIDCDDADDKRSDNLELNVADLGLESKKNDPAVFFESIRESPRDQSDIAVPCEHSSIYPSVSFNTIENTDNNTVKCSKFIQFCDENMLQTKIAGEGNNRTDNQLINKYNDRKILESTTKNILSNEICCKLDVDLKEKVDSAACVNNSITSSDELAQIDTLNNIETSKLISTSDLPTNVEKIDLLKGIEYTLSELLKKESLVEQVEEKPDRAQRPVRVREEATEGGVSAPAASAVCRSRSAGADANARYTSRVMITHDRVSVVTTDTTRLMHDVTVHHTNSQNETLSETQQDSNERNSDEDAAQPSGGVTVVSNADTLSAVVCLEEGLADDDSWVEDVSNDEDVASSASDSDSGDEASVSPRNEEFVGCCRRSLDFTLHTIVEESCEESEAEHGTRKVRPISATELEKYFFFGLGDGRHIQRDDEEPTSDTSSVCSEGGESIIDNERSERTGDSDELVSSRLEKYFLSGFMGFTQERRDSDGSGSVGSDSEGRHSPEHRRKRLVRARGTPRSHSSSLDNLIAGEEPDAAEVSDDSSTETNNRQDSAERLDLQNDTKRKKQCKKSRGSPADERRLSTEFAEEARDDTRSVSEGEDGRTTPRQEFPPLGSELSESKKQTSRDSGFVGSCDDLLRNGDTSTDFLKSHESKIELEEIIEEIRPENEERLEGLHSRPPPSPLTRKDSFNNWSSDEETNLMMTKMRQFFKQMIATSNVRNSTPITSNTENSKPPKPPQLLYFESELTRLMKTVPGIRDEEVREIVEYLSSEDTWSDSYDSSDYAGSDLEGVGVGRSALRRQISESCREIIDEFDRGGSSGSLERDAVGAYKRLAATLGRAGEGSPPLFGKVMRHIGGRLVALMHEVSGGASPNTDDDSASEPGALARSRSHDILEAAVSRGSVASDCERFSWRGSFESALLAADSRGTLGGCSSGTCEARRSPAGADLAAQRSHSRSCGAIGGSEDRLWRGRRRASATDAETEEEQARAGSLPRLPSVTGSAGPVKSARYRAPGFRTAIRAVSAPGLHVPRRRRPAPPTPAAPPQPSPAVTASAPSIQDEVYLSETLSPGHATLPRRSNSPLPHEREIERDRFPLNRSGLQVRSESMASVYSGAGEGARGTVAVHGEVQFSLLYNYRLGALEVGVKRCRDLAAVDLKRNRSDPYVKVYLLPDKSKTGKRKTKVKKNTLNPVFEETLRFVQPLSSLSGRTLWLSVWHADMFGRNDFLGEVTLPLADVVFDDPAPTWYKLQERTEQFDEQQGSKGDLIIGLKFELQESASSAGRSKGTLHVLVKEAKNLVATKPNGLADVFCKSYLLPERGRLAKQKTNVCRRSLNPRWEHTFVYRGLTLAELGTRALELSVWDRDRLTSNDFMGAARLSLGAGTYLSANVNWMDSVGKEVTLWQTMMQRPNFWVEGSLPLRPQLNN